jgi:hypothetical protein
VHEQRQKKNDRQRNSYQPQQSASTKAHDGLHSSLHWENNPAHFPEFRLEVYRLVNI